MANLTISMDDKLIQHIRIEAAKAGKSMSRFVADSLEMQLETGSTHSEIRKREKLERLQQIFDGPKFQISVNGKMPTADERSARR